MHEELYELKEALMEELEEYGSKEMTTGSLEVVDKLAQTVKNLGKIIEKCEEEEYSMGSYAQGGGGSNRGGKSSRGGRSSRNGRGGGRGRSNASYRRGRSNASYEGGEGGGSYAQRYSMGNDELVEELYGLMEEAPDERSRKEFQKFIKKMEMM